MRKINGFLTLLVLPVALVGLWRAIAMADGVTAPVGGSDALPQTVSVWTGLAITLLAAGSFTLRALTSNTSFAHTKLGAAVIAFGCAALTGVVEAARVKGFHLDLIVLTVAGALASTLAMLNPSMTAKPVSLEGAQVQPPKDAGHIPFGVMLVLAATGILMLLFGVGGCGPVSKAYGVAYGACMTGKGVLVVEGIPSKVDTILSSSDSKDAAVSALEGLGMGAATDAVNCAVQAWLAINQVPKNASPSPRLLVGRAAGNEYLARHPSAYWKGDFIKIADTQ